jgi:hypothetical protein
MNGTIRLLTQHVCMVWTGNTLHLPLLYVLSGEERGYSG